MNHIIYYPKKYLIYLNQISIILADKGDVDIYGPACNTEMLINIECGTEDAANKLLEELMKFPPENDTDYVFNVKKELESIQEERKAEHERE